MEPVQITEEEAYALNDAMQREEKARVVLEVAVLRQQWMEATEAKINLIGTISKNYGIKPDQALAYDPNTRTLSTRNGQ